MVSYGRGIFSESTARGGRESAFATDEQHRNREKDPSPTPSAARLDPPSFPQNQKIPSVRRAALTLTTPRPHRTRPLAIVRGGTLNSPIFSFPSKNFTVRAAAPGFHATIVRTPVSGCPYTIETGLVP